MLKVRPFDSRTFLVVGVRLDDVVALLLGGRVEVLLQHLLHVLRQGLPDLAARNQPEAVPGVIGERAEFLDFVEFCGFDQRQRIFLAVGDLGLQRGIGFVERDADGRRAERREHRNPQRHHRHADLEVREVFRRLDRARAASDLAETVVPHRFEGSEPDLLDIAADELADFAVHRRPHLVVIGEGEADAGQRCGRNQRRHHGAGHRGKFQRARTQLGHHVGVAAELIVRETG